MSQFIISAFADEIDPMLRKQMEVLKEHGIRYIEMRGVNGRNLVEYTAAEAREIRKQLDAEGFRISAIGSPIGKIGIADDFRPHLDLFKHTMELAQILGTQYIRMFSFYIPAGESPDVCRDEVMERWSRFIEAAKGSQLVLLHENEKGIYGDTAERCLDLLETMKCGYLKAIFDPANFVQCDVKTYPEAFGLLKKHIAYMHIKDALFSDHSVVPSGQGDGHVREILAELQSGGFEGFLSIEPHLADFVGFAALEPNSPINRLPEGGPKQFAIAARALNKILDSLRFMPQHQ